MARFTLEFWEDDGWYVGRLAEVPGVFSQGESLEELKEDIADAYTLMIQSEPSDIFPRDRSRIEVELKPGIAGVSYANSLKRAVIRNQLGLSRK